MITTRYQLVLDPTARVGETRYITQPVTVTEPDTAAEAAKTAPPPPPSFGPGARSTFQALAVALNLDTPAPRSRFHGEA